MRSGLRFLQEDSDRLDSDNLIGETDKTWQIFTCSTNNKSAQLKNELLGSGPDYDSSIITIFWRY